FGSNYRQQSRKPRQRILDTTLGLLGNLLVYHVFYYPENCQMVLQKTRKRKTFTLHLRVICCLLCSLLVRSSRIGAYYLSLRSLIGVQSTYSAYLCLDESHRIYRKLPRYYVLADRSRNAC